MINNFLITGLPRMRSAWFAAYLTQGDTLCWHEAIAHDYPMDIEGFSNIGTAESGYVLKPDWMEFPPDRIVIIERDLEEATKSFNAVIGEDGGYLITHMWRKLQALPGLRVAFDEIDTKLEEIHEYLGLPDYNSDRAKLFSRLNVQDQNWRS